VRFGGMLLFSLLWLLIVYCPVAHWVWGDGWLQKMGVMDFAGGTVVHLNAGMAALVCALVLGRRRGFPETAMPPHNMTMTVTGAAMLWVGWFGFNAGSAVAANGAAGMAMLVTHIGAATGALMWLLCESLRYGKPSVLGIVTGMVAGLGTITPASGFVLPWHGIVIGIAAGTGCYWACTRLKLWLGYDDSLDVFGVHGIGGVIGVTLTGIFATAAVSIDAATPNGWPGLIDGNPRQVLIQLAGAAVTVAWSGIGTLVILKLVGAVTALRVSPEAEQMGLDVTLHGESIHS
jgi:Amt family ammonium transporter